MASGLIGQTIDKYRIVERLGAGGMGVVYIGEHVLMGNRAAIKVLLPEYSNDQSLVQRFFNEARAATQIKHPGIVQVFDFGHHTDGSAYIAMALLEGESLDARLARIGRFSTDMCLRLLHQIASALQAAHKAGITHRDLKPDNIFLCPDPDITSGERIKLLDFGIAKLSDSTTASNGQTKTGTIMGTPRYMAPEQGRGSKNVDHRADLYALGCIAFAMLCGRPPFLEEGLGDLLVAHILSPPPTPSSLEPSIPEAVEAIVLRLLAKQPDDRFQQASDVVAAIKQIHPSIISSTWPGLPAPSPTAQRQSSHPPVSTLSGATGSVHGTLPPDDEPRSRRWIWAFPVLVLVGVGTALAFGSRQPPPDEPVNRPMVSSSSPTSDASEIATPLIIEASVPDNAWVRVTPPLDGRRIVLGLSPETAKQQPEAIGLSHEHAMAAPTASFDIQQHEVTWAELQPWLDNSGRTVAYQPQSLPQAADERAHLPATGIRWRTAYEYCRSIDARLPSEAEWEFAARGPERRAYAWGRDRLDRVRTHAFAGKAARLVAVMNRDQDRTPGDRSRALFDMMGNAQEWVADLWRNDVPGEDESWVQAGEATYRTVRGLPVNRPPPSRLPIEGAAYREALCASAGCPEGSKQLLAFVGFRCARDATGLAR